METSNIIIRAALPSDSHYAAIITDEMQSSAKARGTGIAKRSPEYIETKINEGKAVIAVTSDGDWVGFCYIEAWGHEQFVANSGLIVAPAHRKSGVAKQIKRKIFDLSKEKYPTLYNSSIMKWEANQGVKIYDYFQKNKEMVLFKYQGIDRYLFNEPVEVDLLPTSIAYSYWKGVRYGKDTTPEKLRTDYEVCILNHGSKQQDLNTWIKDYWI